MKIANVKERLIDNWKTTTISLLITAVSIYLLAKGYATWDQLIGFWTASGLLAWVKDTIFKV